MFLRDQLELEVPCSGPNAGLRRRRAARGASRARGTVGVVPPVRLTVEDLLRERERTLGAGAPLPAQLARRRRLSSAASATSSAAEALVALARGSRRTTPGYRGATRRRGERPLLIGEPEGEAVRRGPRLDEPIELQRRARVARPPWRLDDGDVGGRERRARRDLAEQVACDARAHVGDRRARGDRTSSRAAPRSPASRASRRRRRIFAPSAPSGLSAVRAAAWPAPFAREIDVPRGVRAERQGRDESLTQADGDGVRPKEDRLAHRFDVGLASSGRHAIISRIIGSSRRSPTFEAAPQVEAEGGRRGRGRRPRGCRWPRRRRRRVRPPSWPRRRGRDCRRSPKLGEAPQPRDPLGGGRVGLGQQREPLLGERRRGARRRARERDRAQDGGLRRATSHLVSFPSTPRRRGARRQRTVSPGARKRVERNRRDATKRRSGLAARRETAARDGRARWPREMAARNAPARART